MVTLATIACLTIGVAAGELLAPTAIAIVLALVLAPVSNLLERRLRIPSGFAAVLSVGATISIIVTVIVTFAPSASRQAPVSPIPLQRTAGVNCNFQKTPVDFTSQKHALTLREKITVDS